MTRTSRADDPRSRRSLEALLGAVTALVDGEPIHQISITGVVQAAGVTRPTFYQHFADVPAAAQQAALVRLATAFGSAVPPPIDRAATGRQLKRRIEDRARPVMEHLQAHRDFYVRVLEGAGTVAFFDELVAFVARQLLPDVFEAADGEGAVREDLATLVAGGVVWMVVRWLRATSGRQTAEAMARRIASTVPRLLVA
ncbi:MAG: TetR/AcrR family transcriptional regulator [Pseudomonadota bacterium]